MNGQSFTRTIIIIVFFLAEYIDVHEQSAIVYFQIGKDLKPIVGGSTTRRTVKARS